MYTDIDLGTWYWETANEGTQWAQELAWSLYSAREAMHNPPTGYPVFRLPDYTEKNFEN